MEATTIVYYAVVVFYILINEISDGLSSNLLTEFKLELEFCNFTCPAVDTIFSVNEVKSEAMCTLMCAKAQPCFGVSFQPVTKMCVGCNSTTGLLPLDGALFYKQVPLNIAKGKDTYSSLPVDDDNSGMKAVDGNRMTRFNSVDKDPWWRVDLGALYVVTEIKINWFSVIQARLTILAGMLSESPVAPTRGGYNHIFKFTYGSLKTRYVEVRAVSTYVSFLLIWEFEVFGIPAW